MAAGEILMDLRGVTRRNRDLRDVTRRNRDLRGVTRRNRMTDDGRRRTTATSSSSIVSRPVRPVASSWRRPDHHAPPDRTWASRHGVDHLRIGSAPVRAVVDVRGDAREHVGLPGGDPQRVEFLAIGSWVRGRASFTTFPSSTVGSCVPQNGQNRHHSIVSVLHFWHGSIRQSSLSLRRRLSETLGESTTAVRAAAGPLNLSAARLIWQPPRVRVP